MMNVPALYNDELAQIGARANEAARLTVFADYYERNSDAHTKALKNTLIAWAAFLSQHGVERSVDKLAEQPSAWAGVTAGLVKSFQATCIQTGYRATTANVMLSHIKTFCKMVAESGLINEKERDAILAVRSYARSEMPNIDRKRAITKISAEKTTHTAISTAQAERIKHDHPNTPRGRRNAVLGALLIDYGLRADEIAKLAMRSVNLATGELTVYRSKTHTTQTFALSSALRSAFVLYLRHDRETTTGPLLCGNRKHKPDELSTNAMSRWRIFEEVRALGRDLDIGDALSPHDCRVHWAIAHYRKHRDIARLQYDGGWNSPNMPMHYMQEAIRAEELEKRKKETSNE